MSCYNSNCHQSGDLKRCSGCQHAFYCSRDCQRIHWKRHKANCILPNSSLHDLFEACEQDVMPVPSASCDYGFDNLRMYHRNVPADVESILLGIYQAIRRDILQSEYGDPTEALLYPLLNDFGASKQMILEAYESNSLDAFIQRFVRNALQRRGDACPRYFSDWLHYRLIIGPTRLLLSEEEVLSARDIARMREEIYRTYYE